MKTKQQKEEEKAIDNFETTLADQLERTDKLFSELGLPPSTVGKEVLKTWMDTMGWKMVIVNLMKLSEKDPKGFLQMYNTIGEFASPKSTRNNSDNVQPVSIQFSLPQQSSKMLNESSEGVVNLASSTSDTLQIVLKSHNNETGDRG